MLSLEERLDIDGSQVRIITPHESDPVQRPLVLINGFGAGVNDWGTLPGALDRRILAVDVTKSSRLGLFGIGATMREMSDLAEQAISEITDETPDVLGYSWGGLLAEEMALNKQKDIGKLILVSTGIGGLPVTTDIYGATLHILRQPITDLWVQTLQKINQLSAAATGSLNAGRLHQLDNETLIMAGEWDPISPLQYSLALQAILRRARLYVEPRGQHDSILTNPSGAALIINEFLNEQSPAVLAA